MLYSELKAKAVLSLDGEYLGHVTGAFFSLDTNDCVAICAEHGIFSLDDMYAVKDVVTLKLGTDAGQIPSFKTHMFLTTEMQAYDCKGESLGKVTDFNLEPHNKKEDVLMTERETYPLRKLLFTANDYAILNQGDQLPRKRRAKEDAPQNLKSATKQIYLTPPVNEPKPGASTQAINFHKYGENRFLIGRVLTRAITDLDHTILISCGTTITNEVIEEARRKNKLSELTKFSR